MSETPNLKLLFEDDFGLAYVNLVDGKNVIHSHIKGELNMSAMKQALEYSNALDEAFQQRGIKTLYTWGYTDEQDRYNMFLGYRPTGYEVIIEGWEGPPIFEYSKELI